MKLCVIGTGYVGLTTGACLAAIGHEVVCTDSDPDKIAGLQRGRLPIFEEKLDQVIAAAQAARRLHFTSDSDAAIAAAEVIYICVGTPPDAEGKANLAAVEAVTRQIALQARGYRLIVGKSTVPVHTGEHIKRVLASHAGGRLSFDVASNPEFLREGTGVYDFFHPDRIVVGTDNAPAAATLRSIYAPVLEGSFECGWHQASASSCGWNRPAWVATSIASAELIKHASNSYLSMKISYANAVADLCELAGADAAEVLHGIGLDRRIGRDFLQPGLGFGGFCFPKDLSAFIEMAAELGYDFRLLREVQAINARRVEQFVRKVREELWVLQGKTLGVLGLAFKAGTDDTRLSPAYSVVRELLRLGARIQAFDPRAMERAGTELSGDIQYCASAEAVAEGADAVLILTEWPQFRQADWGAMARRMKRAVVLDGRNLFRAEELEGLGFRHRGIGLPATEEKLATKT
ncbi:MAG: UDP-glucose dehydrogenase family protein [Terriglobales bacterium]